MCRPRCIYFLLPLIFLGLLPLSSTASEQDLLAELDLPSYEHRADLLLGGRLQMGDEFDGMQGQASLGLHLQFGLHNWPYDSSAWSITLDNYYSSSEGGDFWGDRARIDSYESYLGLSYGADYGKHHWNVNPGLGIALMSLRDADSIDDQRELQIAGQLALRYRYQLNHHFTFGAHLSSQASRMVGFNIKKYRSWLSLAPQSWRTILVMLPAYCSNCSDAEQICDLATMIGEDAAAVRQRLGWQRIGLDLRLGGIALREGLTQPERWQELASQSG